MMDVIDPTRSVNFETLKRKVASIKDETLYEDLADVEFTQDGMLFTETGEVKHLDSIGYDKLANYFGINKSYMRKSPPDLAVMNLEYWRRKNEGVSTRFYFWDDALEGVSDSDIQLVSPRQVLTGLNRVVKNKDKVTSVYHDADNFFADFIFEDKTIEVPGKGTDERPVGDITNGGLRLRQYQSTNEPLILETFLFRQICSNGLAEYNPLNRVVLKGLDVDMVMEDVEKKAEEILGSLDYHLDSYKKTSQVAVPGNLRDFIRQVGKERGISDRVIGKAQEMSYDLEHSDVSVYDVINIFTRLANQVTRFGTRKKLQYLGGDLSFDTDNMTHRCSNCEKLLDV